jgi:hypothetical protein
LRYLQKVAAGGILLNGDEYKTEPCTGIRAY